MTRQTWAGATTPSGWSLLSTRQKAGAVVSGALVLCLGLLTVFGALAGATHDGPRPAPATTPAAPHRADAGPSLR